MKPKFICRKPGPKSVRILERDKKVISPSLTREYSFVFKKAKGCHVWDVDGRKYLDFAAGVAVMNIGHTNTVIEKALRRQIKDATHAGFSDFYAEKPVEFVEYLLKFLPRHLNKAFLSNSGTEAVEAAYKLARWHTNKKWAIAFKPSFHGRTMGSLSLTNSRPVQRERFWPFLPVKHALYPYCYRCPFKNKEHDDCVNLYLDVLEQKISECDKDLATVFLEPVSGEGGYIVPPTDFVKGVRELCDDNDILLCSDEVQAGCYRTGKFLAIENFDVKPDIVALSKAIGGGIPLGATVANEKIMNWSEGSHACFHRRAKVVLADGSRKEISEIVNKKLQVDVLSYNYKTRRAEPKKIVNWFKRKNVKNLEWYKVVTTNSVNGVQAPCVTKEHKYWVVNKGWVTVRNLQRGDKILLPIPHPAPTQEQVIIGSLLGDGALSNPKSKNSNARYPHLTIGHQERQLDYLKLKYQLLKNLTSCEIKLSPDSHNDGYDRQRFYYFRTKNFPWLLNYRKVMHTNGNKLNVPPELIKRLNPLGMAVWFMDDGRYDGKWRADIATYNFDKESLRNVIEYFARKYEIYWEPYPRILRNGEKVFGITVNKSRGSRKFFEMIASFVPNCMQYKLPKEFRRDTELEGIQIRINNSEFVPTVGKVIKVIKANNKKQDNTIYDIEVEDNHNYFTPTALVSNSTFGGNLLACAAGIATLKFMREKKLGENAAKIGNYMMKRLEEMKEKYEIIGDVRGIGLMIGVEVVKDKKSKAYGVEERSDILCKASEKGLLLLPAGASAIRICPPLILTKEQADLGLDILEDSIREVL